jgi:hypothetical protein
MASSPVVQRFAELVPRDQVRRGVRDPHSSDTGQLRIRRAAFVITPQLAEHATEPHQRSVTFRI